MIVVAVGLLTLDNLPVGVMHDDGMYVILAKALATGRGYHWINVPGSPAATHFPPGYPALLALVWHAAPSFAAKVKTFKFLNGVLLALSAGTLVHFARKRLAFSTISACVVVLLGAVAIPTLVLSTIVMSEMLFLALLVPVLLLAERVADEEVPTNSAIALGVLAGALILVRTHGVALAAAITVVLLLRRKWRATAMFAVFAFATVLPWQVWQRMHRHVVPDAMRGDYESYGQWLSAGGAGIINTIAGTSREIFGLFIGMGAAGIPTAALRITLGAASIALVLFGLWHLWSRAKVTAAFVSAYFAIVMVWPFTPARFVWGIWPLLVLVAAVGVRALATLRIPVRAAGLLLVAGIAIGYGTYNWRGYRGAWWSSIPRANTSLFGPTMVWISANTRPTDVVATNAEAAAYLYTGRLAVPATQFTAADYFVPPSRQSAERALRSILGAYHPRVVAVIANDTLEAAARALTTASPPLLSFNDRVLNGLIFTSILP